ncbi:MAG: hypothetical protein ACI4TR_04475, partial [Bacteroidaceae bacterium]
NNIAEIKKNYYSSPIVEGLDESVYQRCFNIIPYLKDMWNKYFEELKKGHQPKELEEEINKIKTDLS